MSDFIIDADPFIPTGIMATKSEVADMIVEEIIPTDIYDKILSDQRPTAEDLGAAAKRSPIATRTITAKLKRAGLEVIVPKES